MVTREGIRRIATLFAVVFAAAAVGACGDSGSTTSETSPAKEASSDPGSESKASSQSWRDGGSQSKQGDEGSGGSNASVDPAPLEVSGGGSAQYRTAGDNSVQEFGEEGEEGELEEAATALHDYLAARAEEDWPAACANLARSVTDQLDMLASQSPNLKGKDCAGILAVMTPPLSATVRRESTVVDAGSLRFEGAQAFLIYRGAEGTEYAIVMADEDGSWKVGALAATALP